ncbi:MAG TPA: TPM domain-containing protein [Blastocatellia bacterium]|nr:TPM domain-containing protein [Blastocatellia bacterium]
MKNRARIFIQVALICLFVITWAGCRATLSNQNGETPQANQLNASPLPPPTGFVNDYSNVLDGDTKNRLETTLARLRERSNIEFAVALVYTTGGQPLNDYSLAVARGWKIGPKDSGGLLLLVVVKDHQWRIEVSRSLENDLPNDVALELGRLMNEPFRQQQFGEGITKCVAAIIKRLAERRGFAASRDMRAPVF